MVKRQHTAPGSLLKLYEKLLLLYPKHYRDEYGEQLLLTTFDMLTDTPEGAAQSKLWTRIFIDLCASASKERYAALSNALQNIEKRRMEGRYTRVSLITTVGILGVCGVVFGVFFSQNQGTSSMIAPMTSFEEVQTLSVGAKESCLPHSTKAASLVKADDRILVYSSLESSTFEQAVSYGIRDVPAGTTYDVSVHSYDGTLVHGSLIYEKQYGTYNYIVKKLPNAGEWDFVSMIACTDK